MTRALEALVDLVDMPTLRLIHQTFESENLVDRSRRRRNAYGLYDAKYSLESVLSPPGYDVFPNGVLNRMCYVMRTIGVRLEHIAFHIFAAFAVLIPQLPGPENPGPIAYKSNGYAKMVARFPYGVPVLDNGFAHSVPQIEVIQLGFRMNLRVPRGSSSIFPFVNYIIDFCLP